MKLYKYSGTIEELAVECGRIFEFYPVKPLASCHYQTSLERQVIRVVDF